MNARKQIFDQIIGKIKSIDGMNYIAYCWQFVDGIIDDPNYDGEYYEISKLHTKNHCPLVIDIEKERSWAEGVKMVEPKTVKELKEKRNALEAQIQCIEMSLKDKNAEILIKEILDLLDGVGDYISSDYYAPNRVYSRIDGLKNIRFSGDKEICAKITSPVGYLLPNSIEARGTMFDVVFYQSSKYDDALDY